MAHFVTIEDSRGDLIDLEVYCSDFCAKTSPHYAGWYGAMEVEFDTTCARCEANIKGASGKYEG